MLGDFPEVAQLLSDWAGSKKPDSWFGIFPLTHLINLS